MSLVLRGAVSRGAVIAALAGAAVVGLIWAYVYGGSSEPGVMDRVGPAVLWSLPAAKLVFNLAAACTAGPLVLALFVFAPDEPAHRKALRFAGYSACIWALAAAVFTVVNFQLLANLPLSSDGFASALLSFVAGENTGRPGLTATVIAAVTAVLCFAVRKQSTVALTAAVAFSGLIPLLLNSHAAGGADHADSTLSLFLHSGAAVVWLGGLAGLIWLRRSLPADRLATVVGRYSTLALISFAVLAVSGVLASLAALGSLEQLGTPYGTIVLAKFAAFLVLGAFGALHRSRVIRRLGSADPRAAQHFWLLVVVELGIMGIASGLAASLGRTATPTSLKEAVPESTTPAPGFASYLSQWELDPLWSVACVAAVFLYLAGVRRLAADGVQWSSQRTGLWLAGIGLLFYVTNGGVHVYQGYLFNAHVLTQMLLTAVVPLFLVLASPLTLAERTIRPRTDGSTGCLELIRSLRPLLRKAAAAPYVSVVVLAGSLIAFYYTPLLDYAAQSQLGYGVMTVLALFAGCLCTTALLGSPTAANLTGKLGAVAGAALLYAVYGVALTQQAAGMEIPWESVVSRPWGFHPWTVSTAAGPIMWIIGGIALAVTALLIHSRRGAVQERAEARPAVPAGS